MATNSFDNQVSILAELWMNYRDDEQLQDFVTYNDLGLPLAYLILNELVEPKQTAYMYIEETYALLVASLGVDDVEYETLDEMLGATANE